MLEHRLAHLAAPAGLFVPTERQSRIEDVVAIDPDGSRLQLGGEAVRLRNVLRPYPCRQTVDGVVAQAHGLVESLERRGGDYRTEDFLLHDLHGRLGVDEYGRFDEIAATS